MGHEAGNGLLKQVGGLEQYIDLTPMHATRDTAGDTGRHERRLLYDFRDFQHQIHIAPF